MSLKSFSLFPDLLPEIRILIWQQAYLANGPQIVEVGKCWTDHSRGRCYLPFHTNGNTPGLCCWHKSRQDYLSCKCKAQTEPVEEWLRDGGLPVRANYNGHEADAASASAFHVHRMKYSRISALFSTNREARYEAQRFGQLTYHRRLSTNFNLTERYPIYLNFNDDKLAIDSDILQECGSSQELHGRSGAYFQGLENVQSVIILDPIPTRLNYRGSMFDALQLLPRLKEIHVCNTDTRDRGTAIILNRTNESEIDDFKLKDLHVWREQLTFMYKKIGRNAEPVVNLAETRSQSHIDHRDTYMHMWDGMRRRSFNHRGRIHRLSIRSQDISCFLTGKGVKDFDEELALLCERWRSHYGWTWQRT